MKTKNAAQLVIDRLSSGEDVAGVRGSMDGSAWGRVATVAYQIHLDRARRRRSEDLKRPGVAATSNEEVAQLLALNETLSSIALCLPSLANRGDVEMAKQLATRLPSSESLLLDLVAHLTMHPRYRAIQNVGRMKTFAAFCEFHCLIEAATISYYRTNYPAAYLTLMPVIEGVILRWCGYTGQGRKPDFSDLKRFFRLGHTRQPCPGNPLFYEVFSAACDRIVVDHLFKASDAGPAYREFNRHQALHLLRRAEFATRENCVRLFLLLDTMAELYYYETGCRDARWSLRDEDFSRERSAYAELEASSILASSPERLLLSLTYPV